jgi:biopolymer transport protein TolQ
MSCYKKLIASLLSWTLIFQRTLFIKKLRRGLRKFEDKFWVGTDMGLLFRELNGNQSQNDGMATIFHAGFKEFLRLKQLGFPAGSIVEGTERAMRIAESKELDRLEQNLSMLATIGSTSPYIGLFGTVWGIMTAFQSLGAVQQATIAMVAPGISEALIATAMGLFAAIPAVIA